jgi:nicotinate-nucleotide adenylyltransferase
LSGSSARRIGVFGGTFDPIHNGHLAVARLAREALDLSQVLFLPAANPYLRSVPVAAVCHRMEMVRLAIDGEAMFALSAVDAATDGPTYTLNTLDALTEVFPAARLVLILGADAARGFHRWHAPESIAAMAEIAVISRPGEIDPARLPEGHPARSATYVDRLSVDISGTMIRENLKAGDPVDGMVPGSVERYIHAHGLYEAVSGSGGDH